MMGWLEMEMRRAERRKMEQMSMRPKKPKWKVPKDFHCNNCIQAIGSSLCKQNPKTGEPCKWYTLLLEMAKRGELEREET